MTIEELEIIVDASIEPAINKLKKLMPQIKQTVGNVVQAAQKFMGQIDIKSVSNKIQQSIQLAKKKIDNFKKSNANNEIAIKVNNKEASKQITQLEKQINSLQEKINARQMKLNVITPKLDNITAQTTKEYTPDGISSDSPAIQEVINNSLNSNKEYSTLLAEETKLTEEIKQYNKQLENAKAKMSDLKQETAQTATTQYKLGSFFNSFKGKLEQSKNSTKGLKNTFNQLPKITQNVTNNIKKMGIGIKQGLGHVLKYAGALFSLRGIYSILSNSAQSWLSSQNAQAQQLSANIEYMKYAMGSVFAPVIEYVTNLVYKLMKAIQSLVYAFSGINIFAKATASSMSKTASSASKVSKSLTGVHNEINNVSENVSEKDNSTTPNMDLSQMGNTPNDIIEAIKNGDWYQIGATIGKKLNKAMSNIPWDKIHDGAKSIARNTAQLLNGYIAKTEWNQVGNTFAQGLNATIYFGYKFVTTFDWGKFGKSIGDRIDGFFKNADWATAGKSLGEGIKGVLTSAREYLKTVDWKLIGEDIKACLINIDWNGICSELGEVIGEAIGALVLLIVGMFGDFWGEQWEKFQEMRKRLRK